MQNEQFKITEYEQRRLTIDLLIRIAAELEANRLLLRLTLSKGDPKVLTSMQQAFDRQYGLISRKLRETIFANYGHIDIDDFFPPGDSQ